MKVSLIIPTANRAKYLRNALISVQNQSLPMDDYEIIVVDNHPRDETPKVVAELNAAGGKEIKYVKEPNIGLHNARHAGAKAAEGEILAYIDDDVVCDSNWLFELVKPYSDPQVGCVGGKILPQWEAEPPEWVGQYLSYLSLLDLGNDIQELDTPGIYGCNLSIRRSLLFEVGGFNPDAFHTRKLIWYRGDGETGLLRKVLIAKKRIVYVPQAIVWHIIPATRLTLDYFKGRSFIEGISASFLSYRTEKSSRIRLFFRSCKYGIAVIICKTLALKCRSLGSGSYFEYELMSSVFKSRFIYELKLIYDGRLREHVATKNWL